MKRTPPTRAAKRAMSATTRPQWAFPPLLLAYIDRSHAGRAGGVSCALAVVSVQPWRTGPEIVPTVSTLFAPAAWFPAETRIEQ